MSRTEAATEKPRILVATDFSTNAAAALEWGVELAAAHQGELLLLHALHLYGPMPDFLPSPPDLEETLSNAARQKLEELAEQAGKRVKTTSRLAVGLPSQSIVDAAHELAPAVIVMGSRGLTGVSHLLLGSTAERVVQHAPCPVLTVHPGDREAHTPIRTILVPTDFSPDAEQAATQAGRLLGPVEEGARLVLLHAYHLPLEYTAYGTIPTGLNFYEDVASAAETKLLELAGKLQRSGLKVETLAREGYPPDVIVAVAGEVGADVITMGTHGRTGLRHLLLGSNTERVVQHAGCPVLTVRHPDT